MYSPRKVSCWIYGWIAVRHVDSRPFWGLDSPQNLLLWRLSKLSRGQQTIKCWMTLIVGSVPSWSIRHQTSFWRGQNLDATMVANPTSWDIGLIILVIWGFWKTGDPKKQCFVFFRHVTHISESNTFIKLSFGLKQLQTWDAHPKILPLIW